MITQQNCRHHSGECQVDYLERPLTEALRSLVLYELGYGGVITAATSTRVTVETRVLHTRDVTTYLGSVEEMQLLFDIAMAHVLVAGGENREQLLAAAARVVTRPPISGNPLMIQLALPTLIGGSPATVALLVALGVESEEQFLALTQVPLADLVSAAELHLETGAPFLEIVQEMELVVA